MDYFAFNGVKPGARAIVPSGATRYGEEGSLWNGLIVTFMGVSPKIISVIKSGVNTVTVDLIKPPSGGAMLIVGVYEGNKLLGIKTASVTESGEMTVEGITIPPNADKIVVFMWDDIDFLQSLCQKFEHPLN